MKMTKEQMAEIRNYKIYKHTLPDGSAYIGVTAADKDYKRFDYGYGYSKQPFGKAIIEWGWKAVTTELLAEMTCSWYEAHKKEIEEIHKAVAAGIKLYNEDHITLPKESVRKTEGCTIIEINKYFNTMKEAGEFIGVTKAAISTALKENRSCKGWNLEYGDVTIKEKIDNENH